MMIWFSAMTSKYETVMPTCSGFTTKLSDPELISLATNWSPINNGFTCLCMSRPGIVTNQLLEQYGLPSDKCDNLKDEPFILTVLQLLESISLATVSIVFDFFFMCKPNSPLFLS